MGTLFSRSRDDRVTFFSPILPVNMISCLIGDDDVTPSREAGYKKE